jgi:hypothetical protein
MQQGFQGSDWFNSVVRGVVRKPHHDQPIRPAIRHCNHHEWAMITNWARLF